MRHPKLAPSALAAKIGTLAWAEAAMAAGGKSFGEIYCADRPNKSCRTWGSWNTLTRDQLLARCSRGNRIYRVRNGCTYVI